MKRFPQFGPIADCYRLDLWDDVVSVAMMGVYAHSKKLLNETRTIDTVRSALQRNMENGAIIFNDYYAFVTSSSAEIGIPWSAASAGWVARILRDSNKANQNLKAAMDNVDFVNLLSGFMNIAFGPHQFGFEKYYETMIDLLPSTEEKENNFFSGDLHTVFRESYRDNWPTL